MSWEQSVYLNGTLVETLTWGCLEDFLHGVRESDEEGTGPQDQQLYDNWKDNANRASTHYVDGAGDHWRLVFRRQGNSRGLSRIAVRRNASGKRGQKAKMRKKKARDKRRDARHGSAPIRVYSSAPMAARLSDPIRAQVKEIEREINHKHRTMTEDDIFHLAFFRGTPLHKRNPGRAISDPLVSAVLDYLFARLAWAKSDGKMALAVRARGYSQQASKLLADLDAGGRTNPGKAKPGWWHGISRPGKRGHVAWIPTSQGNETRDAQQYLRRIGVKSHWLTRSGQAGNASKPKSTVPYRWTEGDEEHFLTYWSHSRPHMAY